MVNKIIKIFALLPALLFCLPCSAQTTIKSDFYNKILDLIIEEANGVPVEFPELYDRLVKVIPDDKDERLLLVSQLKEKGFKVTNWGRGNYPPLGPRIITITMNYELCECIISKIYYTTISKSDYKMTESIRCSKLKKQ